MAGILDTKERLFDFIVTEEGRRQATAGQMKFQFATLTDTHTFYAASGTLEPDVAEDASDRIFFEATNKYLDVIVPELEPGNSMRPFRTSDFSISGQQVASGTFSVGFTTKATQLTGSKLQNNIGRALDGIGRNFTNLQLLATEDPFNISSNFGLNPLTSSFHVWTDMPTEKATNGRVDLSSAPSLFADRRFSHFLNFDFLPPKNVDTAIEPGKVLGNYAKLNEEPDKTYDEFNNRLKNMQYQDIAFSDTSRDNNLVGQFFEVNNQGIEKLSIVDYGEFLDTDPLQPSHRVFFIGKLLRDNTGTETFLNIFTVVLE